MNPFVEVISDGTTPLAYIVRADWRPQATEFLTPDDFPQQMGMIVYGAGEQIVPHVHIPVERRITGTTECIVVREGACEIDLYNADREFITSRSLPVGTIVLLLSGGHGFRMTQDTVLFEVKQGPYVGGRDKERFTA